MRSILQLVWTICTRAFRPQLCLHYYPTSCLLTGDECEASTNPGAHCNLWRKQAAVQHHTLWLGSAMDPQLEDVVMSSTRRRWWTAPHILHLLPQLSDLPLSSKWIQILQEFQVEDRNITPPGTSSDAPKKALVLYDDSDTSPWATFQAAVSEEDRSRVAAVLASGPGGVVDVPGLDDEQQWRHLLLCLFMALLPSLPNLHRLMLGRFFDPNSTLEGKEEALEVFYGALLFHHSSLRHLELRDDDAYGKEKSCGHLAHLLGSTHCKLHTLELSEVRSLGADGVGHIARGLESQSTSMLTKLSISYCPKVGDAGAELLAAMLRTNCKLQKLQLCNIDMGGDGVGHLCDALSQSIASSLNTLDISGNEGIGAQGALHLGNMLARNPPALRTLKVRACDLQDEEGHIAKGLQGNTSLEGLVLSDNHLGPRGLKLLFHCLASGLNKSLKKLAISGVGEMPEATKLAAMISSNGLSLLHLDISEDTDYPLKHFGMSILQASNRVSDDYVYSPNDWATHILPAVARNQVLHTLDLTKCRGVDGEEVRTALLELLRVNTTIQHIELDKTPLEKSGKAAAVVEMLRRNKEYGHVLSTMPTSKPRSCRIVLCGREYAGKSTLLNTLQLVYARERGITHYYYQHMKASGQRLWRSLFPPSDHDKQIGERTRGIDIHLLKDEQGGLRMSAWDFAGQREYHALHHFMFPSGNQGAATMFVYTFNPIGIPGKPNAGQVKEQPELKEDFSYWLKFVASNSRPDAPQPQVVVVITNRDRLARKLHDPKEWLTGAHQIISTLAHDFRGVVSVRSEEPFVVNALAAHDPDIKRWVEYMEESFRTTLLGLQEVPSICDMVAKAAQTATAPIVATSEFLHICKWNAEDRAVRVLLDRGEQEWKAVASYLHDAGELIYHDKLPFIVQNPRWFGHGVLGHLVDLFSQDLASGRGMFRKMFTCWSKQEGNNHHFRPQDGFLSRAVLLELLKAALKSVPGLSGNAVTVDNIIQLMLLLNLCYEKESGDPDSGYCVPAIFYDAQAAEDRRPLNWSHRPTPNSIFAGRRLECDDSKRTFLTDGFFPLLQVVLHNNALREWGDNDICRLEKNLFTILVNGMEVMVEYSSSRFSVDILVKSSKSHRETMEFVQSHFIDTIREVCATQEGCPGVSLSEAIIRPACCGADRASPVLCAYRKTNQVIGVSELKRRTDKLPNYVHSWVPVVDEKGQVLVRAGEDSAALLAGEDDNPSTAGASSVITNDLTDLPGQQIFVTTEDVPELHRAAAWARVSRVVPLRFHLKCDCREGEHEVDQQPGRTFYLVDNKSRYALEESTRQGVVLFVASALKMVPGLRGVGSALSSLPLKDGTPVYSHIIETLSERINSKAPTEVTVEELRSLVEEDMQESRPGPWMNAFLNHGDPNMEAFEAFQRDFRLRKVEYNIPSSARRFSWICDFHHKQDAGTFRSVL